MMGFGPDNNPVGSEVLTRVYDENKEWEAYHKLHPSVRKMLQDCPFEFSATDAWGLWEHCVGTFDSLGEFEYQLQRNVDHLRKEEARIGIGRDVPMDQIMHRRIRHFSEESVPTELVLQTDPNAFALY